MLLIKNCYLSIIVNNTLAITLSISFAKISTYINKKAIAFGFNLEWGVCLANKELSDFLVEQCRERKISLRKLSVSSGLSPGTVHNIIKREYQTTLFSLNRLADYLGVKRQYLWQLAGLLQDMDYDPETRFGDPQLRFHFAQADKLPEPARNLIISIVAAIIAYLGTGEIDP